MATGWKNHSISMLALTATFVAVITGCSPSSDTEAAQAHKGNASSVNTSGSHQQWTSSLSTPGGLGNTVPVSCALVESFDPSHVMGIVIDRSGSVEQQPGAMQTILKDVETMIRRVPLGTLVVVQYASDQSLTPSEQAFLGQIPHSEETFFCDASGMNLRQKKDCTRKRKIYENQLACANQARADMVRTILNLRPDAAPATDIWGAIVSVEEIFRAFPSTPKAIVVYSDMQDTQKLIVPDTLDGLHASRVIVRYLRDLRSHGKNVLKVDQKRLAAYGLKFKNWGVQDYEVISLTVPFTQMLFL